TDPRRCEGTLWGNWCSRASVVLFGEMPEQGALSRVGASYSRGGVVDHPENGADPKSTLADPNGFQYGSRPGEPELPPPRDSAPSIEVPTAASWHVHLELRPEELVALHRLGLTKGGLAWREGMDTWQPLRMPSAEVTGTPEPGAMVESGETGPSGMATTHEATPPHEATMPSARANDSTVEQEPLDVDDSDEVTLARDRSNVTVIPTQPPASQR